MNESPYLELLSTLKSEGRLRQIPAGLEGNADVVDFSSNDYMGLGNQRKSCEGYFASGASRLLSSFQSDYTALEKELEEKYGRPALLFNSGYHANVGAVSSLPLPGTIILSDKLVHASIIDGIRLSKAPFERFRHNDVAHLRKLLEKHSAEYANLLVITESVFSMDGDIAPLKEIAELKGDFPNMMLYVDEAHAVGVFGKTSLGVCEELGILDEIDILAGTFGKAVASFGAFIIASPFLHDYLLNTARSFIFSTSIPPVVAKNTLLNFRQLQLMVQEREHLQDISERLRSGLERISGKPNVSRSQIIPLIIGDSAKAVVFSQKLREKGFNALPIRKPTVAAGTERIRFSLSADTTLQQIDSLLVAIEQTWKEVMTEP